VPAPAMALLVRLRYEDVHANHADLAMLVRSGRLNAFEQLITFQDGRWVIDFQGAVYFDPPNAPDTARLLDGLHDVAAHRVVGPVPYLAWTLRFDPTVAATRDDRRVPFNLLAPEETAAAFLADEILSRSPAEIGDRVLQAAGTSSNMHMPMLRMPATDLFVATLLFRPHKTDAEAAAFLADNRTLYDRAAKRGAKRYPWDAVPSFTREDWARHFGDSWPLLVRAKRSYDPAGILGPGPGICSHRRSSAAMPPGAAW